MSSRSKNKERRGDKGRRRGVRMQNEAGRRGQEEKRKETLSRESAKRKERLTK